MESVLRGLAVFAFVMLIFRIAGKRALSEMSNFEFVVLLIVSETTQQALIDDDNSITNAFLSIATLVGATVGLSFLKQRFPVLDRALEGTPVLLIQGGHPQLDRMRRARVGFDEIMMAARKEGLERLDQIKHAVLEAGGGISIIPASKPSD
ncbi:MAG: DUF421 domain-containing protein [Proteobacteria bacterium]|nr:DUF421 domain-containing protein [Pseudomonadota bacterium]